MKEFILTKTNIMNFHKYIFKINSLDFQITAPTFHQKLFGNLKWTPESSNQINAKRGAILLIIILQLTEEY